MSSKCYVIMKDQWRPGLGIRTTTPVCVVIGKRADANKELNALDKKTKGILYIEYVPIKRVEEGNMAKIKSAKFNIEVDLRELQLIIEACESRRDAYRDDNSDIADELDTLIDVLSNGLPD